MASLATIVNRFVGVEQIGAVEREVKYTRVEACRLRPLPNEDVYLFVKRIDNRDVVRAADPAARKARVGSMLTGFTLATLFIVSLAPMAYNQMEGFHIATLRREQKELQSKLNSLDVQEANLLSPERLHKLAEQMGLHDPAPEAVQYTEGKTKAEAMMVRPADSTALAKN
jgi:cell division protein FtsL